MDAKMTSDDGNEEIEILIEDPDFAYRRHVPDDPLETGKFPSIFCNKSHSLIS